jgi:Holliday junction resolvase RusA-like endonuclease
MRVTAEFEVPLVRGKGRARFVRATGRTYTPTATTDAMAQVQAAFLATGAPMAPRGVPVAVSVETERRLPASRPKRVEREPDVVKPDADNVAKLVLDALNGVAWEDDTQVTALSVVKRDRTRREGERTVVRVGWDEVRGDGPRQTQMEV